MQPCSWAVPAFLAPLVSLVPRQRVSSLPWDRGFLFHPPPASGVLHPSGWLAGCCSFPSSLKLQASAPHERSDKVTRRGLGPSLLQWPLTQSCLPARGGPFFWSPAHPLSTWWRPTRNRLGVRVKSPRSEARPIHPMLGLHQFATVWGDVSSLRWVAGTFSSESSSLLGPG